MADAKGRFTAWLSIAERRKVKEEADKFGTSENYIVRLAVRKYFGMPVPGERNSDRQERV